MVNLISPSNSKTAPASAETSRANQSQSATTSSNIVQANELPATNKTQQAIIQWAKIESNTPLNTQQKAQLAQTNPELAKQLISQIKPDTQGANFQTITPQNAALLKQSPLHLLKLNVDNSLVRIVTPNNVDTVLVANASNTATQLPLVKNPTGWQLATGNQLKAALQSAAAQLLKQNLPLQTPATPLFKLAQTVSNNQHTILANWPKTQTQVQSLNTHIINDLKTQNTPTLSRELSALIKPNTLLNSVTSIQNSLKNEAAQLSQNTVPTPTKNLKQLQISLSRLDNIIKTAQPSQAGLKTHAINLVSSLQNSVQTLSNNNTLIPTSAINNIIKIIPGLAEGLVNVLNTSNGADNAQIKQALQDNALSHIVHQLTSPLKLFNTLLSNTPNSPINTAIMQLLGVAVHGQKLDHSILQNKTQQQFKQLLEQISAKLQINQLRHLGLDAASKELPNNIIQNLQGEIPLRFNEQILPLSYSIQGFAEKEAEQEDHKNSDNKKEQTRRWQIFMSLDLPNNETLHCKLSLINDQINTTLWAESATLCEKTQQALSALEKSLTEAGLTVETVQCFQGKPPQDDTSLSYNLVDITT